MAHFKVMKKVIAHLEKCYSIAPLHYNGEFHILVAAEKHAPCLLFDKKGELKETIWEEPGGVMTMVQVPGTDGQFLATHKFYSPNDSKEAKIVVVTPMGNGQWEVRTLVSVPHVHRFDILTRNGKQYLFVCTLKSGHLYQDDWSSPGKVYAAELPMDISDYDEEHQLKLEVVKDNLLKNHGYCRDVLEGIETGIVSCEQGVFRFTPPADRGQQWLVETLLASPVSDMAFADLDEDGRKEMIAFAPFHGDSVEIYKKQNGDYKLNYKYPGNTEFAHAIYGGQLCGKNAFIIGHRKGKRNLLVIEYDQKTASYQTQILDEDCGSANILHFLDEGKDMIISANREIDEVALYCIT